MDVASIVPIEALVGADLNAAAARAADDQCVAASPKQVPVDAVAGSKPAGDGVAAADGTAAVEGVGEGVPLVCDAIIVGDGVGTIRVTEGVGAGDDVGDGDTEGVAGGMQERMVAEPDWPLAPAVPPPVDKKLE